MAECPECNGWQVVTHTDLYPCRCVETEGAGGATADMRRPAVAEDTIKALRAAARSGEMPLGQSFDVDMVADLLEAQQTEIERLRAAGDGLAAWLEVNSTSAQQMTPSMHKVLDEWKEVRRG